MKAGKHGSVQIICEVDGEGKIYFLRGGDLFLGNKEAREYCGLSVYEVFKDYPSICRNLKKALRGEEFNIILRLGKSLFEIEYSVFYNDERNVNRVLFIATAKVKLTV